jgi:hypothetical protein
MCAQHVPGGLRFRQLLTYRKYEATFHASAPHRRRLTIAPVVLYQADRRVR